MLTVAVNKLHLSAGQLKLFPYLYFVCVRLWWRMENERCPKSIPVTRA